MAQSNRTDRPDRPGKREYYSPHGGVTEFDLIRLKKDGNIAEENLKNLGPYFEKLKKVIHDKWEIASLTDEETLKILKYQLKSLTELQRLMILDVSRGKQAAKKLEDEKNGK